MWNVTSDNFTGSTDLLSNIEDTTIDYKVKTLIFKFKLNHQIKKQQQQHGGKEGKKMGGIEDSASFLDIQQQWMARCKIFTRDDTIKNEMPIDLDEEEEDNSPFSISDIFTIDDEIEEDNQKESLALKVIIVN